VTGRAGQDPFGDPLRGVLQLNATEAIVLGTEATEADPVQL
jgi:hypothetical protein